MREMGLDIEYTGKHQSAEALGTAYDKLSAETDAMQEKAFEKDFQAYKQRTMQSIAQEGVVREPQSIEMQDMRRNPDTVHEELREPLLDTPRGGIRAEALAVEPVQKEVGLPRVQGAPPDGPGGRDAVQARAGALEVHLQGMECGLKDAAQDDGRPESGLHGGAPAADIFVSGTGSEMFVNFAKSIGSNAAMAAAMVALGFVLPRRRRRA